MKRTKTYSYNSKGKIEFFDLEEVQKNIKYIRQLRKDINLTIEKAKLELNPNLAF